MQRSKLSMIVRPPSIVFHLIVLLRILLMPACGDRRGHMRAFGPGGDWGSDQSRMPGPGRDDTAAGPAERGTKHPAAGLCASRG